MTEKYGYVSIDIGFLKDAVDQFITYSSIDLNEVEDKDILEVEDKPHITIRYGFESNVTKDMIEEKLFDLDEKDPITVTIVLGDIRHFEAEDHDIVYASILVGGDSLKQCNTVLRELPGITTFQNYTPHMTFAKVKKGKGKNFESLDFKKSYDKIFHAPSMTYHRNGQSETIWFKNIKIDKDVLLQRRPRGITEIMMKLREQVNHTAIDRILRDLAVENCSVTVLLSILTTINPIYYKLKHYTEFYRKVESFLLTKNDADYTKRLLYGFFRP